MKSAAVFIFITLFAVTTSSAAPATPLKMRPYTGIGVLMLPVTSDDRNQTLPLYAEPGLSRQGFLNPDKLPAYDWIFGASSSAVPLIVMGRKGSWLRIAYDDAGREAWLNQERSGRFQTWEYFFKSQVASILPGLQKKYLQLYQQPGKAVMASLTPLQYFKVLRIENDWAMVIHDQNSLGWLRWRDEDGRLLIGVSTASAKAKP